MLWIVLIFDGFIMNKRKVLRFNLRNLSSQLTFMSYVECDLEWSMVNFQNQHNAFFLYLIAVVLCQIQYLQKKSFRYPNLKIGLFITLVKVKVLSPNNLTLIGQRLKSQSNTLVSEGTET